MTEQTDNLQEQTNDVSITDEASSNTVDSAAGNTAIKDTPTDPQSEIINQQKSTIDALMQRTEELTKQINTLLAMGVQINDGNNAKNEGKVEDIYSDDYVSLSELGANIGKR